MRTNLTEKEIKKVITQASQKTFKKNGVDKLRSITVLVTSKNTDRLMMTQVAIVIGTYGLETIMFNLHDDKVVTVEGRVFLHTIEDFKQNLNAAFLDFEYQRLEDTTK